MQSFIANVSCVTWGLVLSRFIPQGSNGTTLTGNSRLIVELWNFAIWYSTSRSSSPCYVFSKITVCSEERRDHPLLRCLLSSATLPFSNSLLPQSCERRRNPTFLSFTLFLNSPHLLKRGKNFEQFLKELLHNSLKFTPIFTIFNLILNFFFV